MRRVRRLLAALSIVGASLGGAALLSGEASAATPPAPPSTVTQGPCTVHFSNVQGSYAETASVVCSPVRGEYRIGIKCHDGINGVTYVVNGRYVTSGKRSTASCSSPQRQHITYYRIQAR